MDSFLFYGDYIKQIQSDNLQQIINNNTSILESAQLAGIEECVSYLKQKYDVSNAFNPIVKYNKAVQYNAGQVLYLDAPAYSNKTYSIGEWVAQAGNIYSCKTAILVGEVFNAAKWDLIGIQYAIYTAKYPQPIFNCETKYSVGSEVFWKNKTYTALIASTVLSHEAQLQLNQSHIYPIINIFPDDEAKGVQYWGVGVDYKTPIDSLNDTDYILNEDYRDQKLLQICIDITLYHLHCRISPRNIPELRVVRYMGEVNDRITLKQRILYPTYSALGWLQAATIGNDITPSMPTIQPSQGNRIRYGGNAKNVNSY